MQGLAEKLFAGRWVAGPSINDAISRSKKFNARNIATIINYLGEELTDRMRISAAFDTYMKLLDEIKSSGINASISVKPSQLGLAVNYRLFESNYMRILRAAASLKIFVWLDMEGQNYISSTIKAYMNGIKNAGDENISGICIQANMRRSFTDIKKILAQKGIIRLVKGAYSSGIRQQYQSRTQVDNNFINLMKYIYTHSGTFMIATHDIRIIELSMQLSVKYKRNVTYAMLNGIRNHLAVELARKEKVAVYVPFGPDWVAYSYRRLKEAGHLSIILKSLLENQGI